MAFKERTKLFEALTSKEGPSNADEVLDFDRFRLLCFAGIPDEPAYVRPKCWKILLNFLPFDQRDQWDEVLYQQRKSYYMFVRDLITDPSAEEFKNATGKVEDHPLNSEKNSKWQVYFEEAKFLEQIDKDVRRTLPDIAFFQQPVPENSFCPLSSGFGVDGKQSPAYETIPNRRALFKRVQYLYENDEFGARSRNLSPTDSPNKSQGYLPPLDDTQPDLHWEAIERVLFIFAKLNPGVNYIQGMNEILAPIYFVFATDTDAESRAHAEADSFFCFTAMMGEFRDHFIRSLDNVSPPPRATPGSARLERKQSEEEVGGTGIGNSMNRLMRRLRRRDPELYRDLQFKQIHATFFSFRWLSVLLTQEFPLPDVIRIWDSLIADIAIDIVERGGSPKEGVASYREGHFDFLIEFCTAMLVCVREQILASPFGETMRLLQNYPLTDVSEVIQKAYEFRLNPIVAEVDEEFEPTVTKRSSLLSLRTAIGSETASAAVNKIGSSITSFLSKVDEAVLGPRPKDGADSIGSVISSSQPAPTAKSALFGGTFTSGFSAVGGSITGLLGVRTRAAGDPATNQDFTSTTDIPAGSSETPPQQLSIAERLTRVVPPPAPEPSVRDAWQFAGLPTTADTSSTLARAKKMMVDGAKAVGTSFEKLTIASLQALDPDGSEPVVKNKMMPTTTIVHAVEDPVERVVRTDTVEYVPAEKVEADKVEVVQKSNADKPSESMGGDTIEKSELEAGQHLMVADEVTGTPTLPDRDAKELALSEADITTAL
ncbi:rab-GTPase-TBC domain-containing protein [Cladochytrium replicatum]|nr:rab-GTPase-TBC domain-containing protein [Cladochytrium replicatum]